MEHKKILIITHTGDNTSVDTVIRCIEAAGGEAVRFDVDRYPLETTLTTSFHGRRWSGLLHTPEADYPLEDVTAVWYRRSHGMGKGLQRVTEPQYLPAIMGELKHTLMGMLEGLPCFQLERFSVCRRLDSKEEQLKTAARCGLLIPNTCISNDPDQVRAFINRVGGPVVTKMQSAFAINGEEGEQVVFTSSLTPASAEALDSLRLCPMVFQQKIEKKLELRVTIVGSGVFAFSIDSQKLDNAKTDWRKEGLSLVNDWQPYELPRQLEQQLLDFMDACGLNYGAIDLLLTPGDEYYFLEVNAAGEYFWLDRLCEHAISRQIAAVLLGDAARRRQLP